MRKIINFLIFFGIIININFSCEKDETKPDLTLKFIGPWELIGSGNGQQINFFESPSHFWNFKNDSSLLIYNYIMDTSYNVKYWVDTLLYLQTYYPDAVPLIEKFKYQFYEDTMKLDRASGFFNENTYIFRKKYLINKSKINE